MPRSRRTFSRSVLLSQLIVVVSILVLVTGIFAWMGARNVTDLSVTKALTTARTLAAMPEVRDGATRASQSYDAVDPALSESLQRTAEDVRARSEVQFAVITDDRGIRLTHPNPELIGQMVSTSPAEALSGRENISHEQGTLGETVRAKVPIYSTADDGVVVGQVSIGIRSSILDSDLQREFLAMGAVAVFALVVGVIASVGLGRRLRRATLGVGPEELAAMARDQGAVLRGIDDGVLAFDSNGELALSNAAAAQLLAPPPEASGTLKPKLLTETNTPSGTTPSAESNTSPEAVDVVPDAIREMMSNAPDEGALRRRLNIGGRILLATAVRVSREGVAVGGVVTLRDETQMLTMARQLDSVTTMARALRTQRHEFANRLHTVLGLVDSGAESEAHDYLATILRTGPIAAPVEGLDLISDPYLRALLEAKGTIIAEAGAVLAVTPDSLVLGQIQVPEDVTLILGNLIDNALRAVVEARGAGEINGRIEVQLLGASTDLHAVITDSGAGVAEEDVERIFEDGVSGSQAAEGESEHGLGIGLALCRQIAHRHRGKVWVIDSHDPELGGASFGVELPGVLRESVRGDERGRSEPESGPSDSDLEEEK